MDKARFAGATALQYFGLVSKKVSIDEAANQLVQELTEEGSTHGGNGSAVNAGTAAAFSNAAKAALQIMYGQAAGHDHDRQCMSGKIDAARKKFLKGVGDENKEQSAADFDNKVRELLAQKLSHRVRSFHGEQKRKLDAAFRSGSMTKNECDQNMLELLDQVGNAHSLNMEVENALKFIGNDEKRVARGLCYLFAGDLGEKQNGEFSLFDRILDEVVDLSCRPPRDDEESKTNFRRDFIAASRRQLASRLPEQSQSEYFSIERKKREEMNNKEIDYRTYRDSMRDWIIDRDLNEAVSKTLESVKTEEDVCKLLAYVLKNGKHYSHRHGNFFQRLNPDSETNDLCSSFREASYQYACSDTVLSLSERRKFEQFVSASTRRLLTHLPKKIEQARREHKKVIAELRNNKIISAEGYRESRYGYLLNMISPGQGKSDSASRVTGVGLDGPNPEGQDLQGKVAEALAECIRKDKQLNDVLEALIMCWGGFVNNRRPDFSLYPLGKARKEYQEAKTNSYSAEPLTKFRFDNDFSIEARKQLCEKLPDDLRQKYIARDQLLRTHLEKGLITPETYREGMEMFLRTYFKG